jgi:hypothetical protein
MERVGSSNKVIHLKSRIPEKRDNTLARKKRTDRSNTRVIAITSGKGWKNKYCCESRICSEPIRKESSYSRCRLRAGKY